MTGNAGKKKPQYGGRWKTVRVEVLVRDKYLCQIQSPKCTIKATEVDHIQPVHANGAWWDPTNLRASCKACNLARNTKRKTKASREW